MKSLRRLTVAKGFWLGALFGAIVPSIGMHLLMTVHFSDGSVLDVAVVFLIYCMNLPAILLGEFIFFMLGGMPVAGGPPVLVELSVDRDAITQFYMAFGIVTNVLFYGGLASLASRLLIRQDRLKRGLCVRCAYDLTGLPVPRCPECNTAFDPSRVRHIPAPGHEETPNTPSRAPS